MFCGQCGEKLGPATRFCTRCAASTRVAMSSATRATTTEPAGWMKVLARLFGMQSEAAPDAVAALPSEPAGDTSAIRVRALSEPTLASTPRTTAEPVSASGKLSYRLNHRFLTRAEASSFRVLQLALPD